MIAADTSRSLIYFEELIKYKLIPNYVLLMLNDEQNPLPGKKNRKSLDQIKKILVSADVSFDVSFNSDINSQEIVDTLSSRHESTFIYSGFGGVLVKSNILSLGKEFLHIHGGYLPDYKGSTTNYFSLIEENMMGASSIFLTKEIDCGPVLIRRKYSAPVDRSEIDHTHDSKLRAKVLIETLQKYIKKGSFDFELESNVGGDTYYIIHPVLKHLAIMSE